MKIIYAAAMVLGLFLQGCISSSISDKEPTNSPVFKLDVIDVPDQKHFSLILKSLDAKQLCLHVEQWPAPMGGVHFGSDKVFLDFEGGSMPIRDSNFGYCPGGCGVIKIEPNSELRALIPYIEFGDPDQIQKLKDKRLRFPVTLQYCKKN
jgi:hypothetical protein